MPSRPHRLAPALLALTLAGCCVRQPSSVDAVPGGWINLAELPGVPVRKLADGGQPPAKGPVPLPPPVSGETGTSPIPVPPVARIPDVPVKDPQAEKPAPAPVAGSGGIPPEPVAVVGDDPGRARPIPGPSPVALPNPGQPTSPPLAEGRAVIPSIAELGQRSGHGGAGLALADAAGRTDGLSRPSSLPGLAGLPSEGASPRPSLEGASVVEGVPAPTRSPSIGGLAGQGDSAASRAVLPRVPAEQSNDADGPRGFSLGILPGQPRRVGGQGIVAPSPVDSPRPGSSSPRINAGTPASPSQGTPSALPVPRPELGDEPSAPSVFGQFYKGPRPIGSSGAPATSSAAAPVRPKSIEAPPRGAVDSVSGSPGLPRLPSSAATAPTPQQPIKSAPPATGPSVADSSPLASGPASRASLPARSPLADSPSPAPAARLPAVPSPGPRPSEAEVSPRAPVAAADAQLAVRRMEELREEYAAYEREAARLRAILRRALGLDEPADPEPASEGGEPVRVNGDGK